ncbi:hypothetical protein OS493_021850 [Desmophyllum pertusum]|uniref:Uncharacterized protein n=1 Tax=Desmophyllum pertusum TaxID=174260 RepID=A0A9W9ZMP5_9CNID|nr:hypothetical protein OS493_021850 [Desmophyllum pertusum]
MLSSRNYRELQDGRRTSKASRYSWSLEMFLSMVFVLSYINLVFAKPLFLEMPFVRSQAFNQQSHDQDSQPQGDTFEPEESISQESDVTSDVNGFLEIPSVHNRTARNAHSCISGMVRVYDPCRSSSVDKVQCSRSHPYCNHVIPTYGTPKCQTVFGFRKAKFIGQCDSLPIDCKCAA